MDPSPCQKVEFTKNLDILSEIRQIQSELPSSATKMWILAAEFSYIFAAESNHITSEGVPGG